MALDRAIVACGTCHACCKNEAVFLRDGDSPELYDTIEGVDPMTGQQGIRVRTRPDGNCVYLSDEGCSIWERAPAVCRMFDCVGFYQMLARELSRPVLRRHLQRDKVAAAGKERAGRPNPP